MKIRFLSLLLITYAILMKDSFSVNAAEKEPSSVSESVAGVAESTGTDDFQKQIIGIGMYKVVDGDNLWKIAEKLWGDGNRYPQLFSQNRDILADSDAIQPGQNLAYFIEGETEDHALTWEEEITEQVVRRALIEIKQMDEDEQAQFMARPVMASDMEAITDISFSRKNNADTTYKPRLHFRVNEYEENVDLEVGQQYSYADLVNFTALKEIYLSIDLPDYSFLSVMSRLESININSGKKVENLDFLRGRTNLRSLRLNHLGFHAVTEVSVLKNCTEIENLWLDTPKVTDFSFLKDCTKIRNFTFTGSAQPDLKWLPEAEYLHFGRVTYRRDEEGNLIGSRFS
ncbi:MAG: LysM peptidoglycan-binding domain-containing protein [Lachnospiraceae bacterium]|nr:LysM peptidoglycan-binding domain-containing protein [Lachnospiraceae bacterium]